MRDYILFNLQNEKFAAGKSRRLPSNFSGCVIWEVFGLWIFLAAMANSFWVNWAEARNLEENGREATVEVLSASVIEATDSDETDSYTIRFRFFDVNETQHVVSEYVSAQTYQMAERGEQLTALYDPANPQGASVQFRPNMAFLSAGSIAIIPALVVLTAIIFWLYGRQRHHTRFVREGQMIYGRVIAFVSLKDADDDTYYEVVGEFTSPKSARKLEVRQRLYEYSLQGGPPLESHARFKVFYLNDERYQVM